MKKKSVKTLYVNPRAIKVPGGFGGFVGSRGFVRALGGSRGLGPKYSRVLQVSITSVK